MPGGTARLATLVVAGLTLSACATLIGLEDSTLDTTLPGEDGGDGSTVHPDGAQPGHEDSGNDAGSGGDSGRSDGATIEDGSSDGDAASHADASDGAVVSEGGCDEGTSFVCAGVLCVPLDDPMYGCGPAGGCLPCPGRSNAVAVCSTKSNACSYACNVGHLDCDGQPTNGCEVDPKTDVNHCGNCTTKCTAPNNVCSNGVCVNTCNKTTCGTECVDLQTSVTHCGTCPNACPDPVGGNGTASCSGGQCHYTCAAGYGDCDGDPSNGCETFVKGSDPLHCGTCAACALPAHAFATCTAGVCGQGSCIGGWGDCNGGTDGCETQINGSDPLHCGSCNACPPVAHAASVCNTGVCGQGACATGYGDCNGGTDGCETVTNGNDASHCGSCAACTPFANAAPACASGTCVQGTCNAGYMDCSGLSDGCETFVQGNDASHCGSCSACTPFTNAAPACSSGMCVQGACLTGYADCNGGTDGCETSTTNDPAHCGGCTACPTRAGSTPTCTGGICGFDCINGAADCDGDPSNGCECPPSQSNCCNQMCFPVIQICE